MLLRFNRFPLRLFPGSTQPLPRPMNSQMFTFRTPSKHPLLSLVLTVLFVYSTWGNLRQAYELFHKRTDDSIYTYVKDDFPENFPMNELPHAYLVVEDSVHYQLDTPDAVAEWLSMSPPGEGFVHLGPDDRPFSVSMFHQLHCLHNFRKGIIARDLTDAQMKHLEHCLNYMRQCILCSSNLRLEPKSDRLMELHHIEGIDGLDLRHECRDWSAVYDAVEKNYDDWRARVGPDVDI